MTFLNPAVLFGLIATAIPVLIHLLNLRKLKRIEFSTLSFLKELQKNKIRKIKVKQWLLLALRVLIILFLVAAFARPAIRSISLGGAASSAKTTAVFILDNTFSMSVINEKGSSFNRARQVIKNLLYEMQEGDEVVLIPTAELNSNEAQATSNLVEFRKLIDRTDISYTSGTLHNAVVKAAKILGESKNFNKEIYLLSDFQESRLKDREEALSDLSAALDESVKMYMFDFSGKDIFNLGITNLELNNQIPEKDKTISFAAEVKNYSQTSANNVIASLFINGERSAQQSISLAAGEVRKIIFEAVLKQAGIVNVSTELEDDDILQDNKRTMVFEVPEKISVLVIADNSVDTYYPGLALSTSMNVIEYQVKNFSQIPSIRLEDYNTVMIIGYRPGASIDRISSYVNNGGSVLLMPGGNTTLGDFREVTGKLQLPSPSGTYGSINSGGSSAIFDQIDYEHPIFTGLFEKSSRRQIESPEVYYYFKVTSQGKGKSIISLADNSSFLSEYSIGKGKIIMINTAPVLEWANLPLKGIFVPLITKSIFYLTSGDQQIEVYPAGAEISIPVVNTTIPQIKIVMPDKSEEFINMDNKNQDRINFTRTEVTGNYFVYSGTQQIYYFSITANPLESEPERISSSGLEDYLKSINFRGTNFTFNPDENYTNQIQQARFGSELWKYFLLLALILALIEMMIARSAKKDINNSEGQ